MCIKEITEEPLDIEKGQPVSRRSKTVRVEIRVISDHQGGYLGTTPRVNNA